MSPVDRWLSRVEDWQAQSACSRVDPSLFFSGEGGGRVGTAYEGVCSSCPVRDACLEFALESPWRPYGVWGGRSASDLYPEWQRRHPAERQSEVLSLLGLA